MQLSDDLSRGQNPPGFFFVKTGRFDLSLKLLRVRAHAVNTADDV